jgi:hypothetical protein
MQDVDVKLLAEFEANSSVEDQKMGAEFHSGPCRPIQSQSWLSVADPPSAALILAAIAAVEIP